MQFFRQNLANNELVHIYKKILLPRMIEEKMLVLLRQGKISKWFSGIGQEAIAGRHPWPCRKTNGSCPAPESRCVHIPQHATEQTIHAVAG